MVILAALISMAANSQTVFTSSKVISRNGNIRVQFSGFPGNAKDWIAISGAGSIDPDYLDFVYTDGKKSGTIIFRPQEPGLYEVRGYFDNGYTVMTRYRFRISNHKIPHGHTNIDRDKKNQID